MWPSSQTPAPSPPKLISALCSVPGPLVSNHSITLAPMASCKRTDPSPPSSTPCSRQSSHMLSPRSHQASTGVADRTPAGSQDPRSWRLASTLPDGPPSSQGRVSLSPFPSPSCQPHLCVSAHASPLSLSPARFPALVYSPITRGPHSTH